MAKKSRVKKNLKASLKARSSRDREPVLVLGCKGWGSVLAEAFLTLGGLPYRRDDIDMETDGPSLDRLYAVNPLGQVPTLILPDGQVLTESLAVAHYVNDLAPNAKLIPPAKSKERVAFLRWSVFVVAALYPTWRYGDKPEQWVLNADAAASLRETTDAHRKALWQEVEAVAKGPYFLGKTFSLIDVYIAAMVNWRPRQDWFAKEAPKLMAIARRVHNHPKLKKVWRENFGA